MNRWTRAAALVGVAATAAVLMTACKNGGYSAATSATSTPAPAAAASLTATVNPALGQIVTDANGFTLYRFDLDTASPSTSNCAAGCAALWPPVTGTPSLSGIDASLVGSTTRADGTKQVTLKGWPLYRFAKDTKPGDVLGQGVKGTWFAVTPQGTKATATAPAPSDSASEAPNDTSGGY
jgi:predicted lipoprotein with Yx(FWY)xxD motif